MQINSTNTLHTKEIYMSAQDIPQADGRPSPELLFGIYWVSMLGPVNSRQVYSLLEQGLET